MLDLRALAHAGLLDPGLKPAIAEPALNALFALGRDAMRTLRRQLSDLLSDPSQQAAVHALWDRLFARQSALLPSRAVPEHLRGLSMLAMEQPGIPDFARLNERLIAATGWQVVAVPGLVPDAVVADYMQAYGEGGLKALRLGGLENLARLTWYTVQFGRIRTLEGLRIYGAGIVSSHAETLFALESPAPNRIAFSLRRVMQTTYRIDDFQQSYFVINSFEDLLRQTQQADLTPVYAALAAKPPLAPATVLLTDMPYTPDAA